MDLHCNHLINLLLEAHQSHPLFFFFANLLHLDSKSRPKKAPKRLLKINSMSQTMFTQLCVSFSNTPTMHFSLEVFLTTKPCDYIFVKLRTWLCVCEKTSMKTKVSIFLQFGCATGWRGITQQIITKHCVPRQLAVTSSRQQQLEQCVPSFLYWRRLPSNCCPVPSYFSPSSLLSS